MRKICWRLKILTLSAIVNLIFVIALSCCSGPDEPLRTEYITDGEKEIRKQAVSNIVFPPPDHSGLGDPDNDTKIFDGGAIDYCGSNQEKKEEYQSALSEGLKKRAYLEVIWLTSKRMKWLKKYCSCNAVVYDTQWEQELNEFYEIIDLVSQKSTVQELKSMKVDSAKAKGAYYTLDAIVDEYRKKCFCPPRCGLGIEKDELDYFITLENGDGRICKISKSISAERISRIYSGIANCQGIVKGNSLLLITVDNDGNVEKAVVEQNGQSTENECVSSIAKKEKWPPYYGEKLVIKVKL